MPKIADIMTTDVITVIPNTELREVAELLASHHINGVPVVGDDNEVLGVVCESDLVAQNRPLHIPTVFFILDSVIPLENPFRLQKEFKRISATTVEDIYSRPAVCLDPDMDISEAAVIMSEKKYYTLPVVKEGKLVGIIGQSDIIKTLI